MTSTNQRRAVSLAFRSFQRSAFIVNAYRSTFDDVRREEGNSALPNLKCYEKILRAKLSPDGQSILDRASVRCGPYRGLLNCFRLRARKLRSSKRESVEKAMLRASVAFELRRSKRWPNWSLGRGGLERVSKCFLFLEEFIGNGGNLSGECRNEHGETYFEFLPFFLALCGALQEDENRLTPTDALFFGLVDSIRDPEPVWMELLAAH